MDVSKILKQQREMEQVLKPMRELSEIVKHQRDIEKSLEPMRLAKEFLNLEEKLDPMTRVMRDEMKIVEQHRDLHRSLEPILKMMRDAERQWDMMRSPADTLIRFPQQNHDLIEGIEETRAETAEAPTARRAVARILDEILSFQSELDDEFDIGIQLVTLSNFVLHVEDVGYYQPNLIVFYGTINGNQTRVVQHLSQLSFVLTSVRRAHPEEPRREIGFHVEG